MLGSVLVANRGEIACRVFRTCRELGIAAVAVFSDADEGALHVREADTAVRLPGAAPSETYLRGDLIVKAALAAGADAVHPGYGFLSENADFARAVEDAGLVWIGPPPAAIEAMASKTRAKELMGFAPLDPASLTEGDLPVLVKAAAGGGGRGMRIVRELPLLERELAAARAEAESAFGDGEVFVEPYVERGRHVEVQIAADAFGTVWALGTRDCSLQRRHQKVIEECPAPGLPDGVFGEVRGSAARVARTVGYRGVGTVEFLVSPEGRAHFLEMNTRLQVEHPVTEAVYGIDLVALQLRLAEGAALPDAPPAPHGHAVEARLYAEDPGRGWTPTSGALHALSFPTRPPSSVGGSAPDTPGGSAAWPGPAAARGAGGAPAADGGVAGLSAGSASRAPGAAVSAGGGFGTPGGPAGPENAAVGGDDASAAVDAHAPAGRPAAPAARVPVAAGVVGGEGPAALPWVRVDAGYAAGDAVGVHYDAMVAKVIAWGATREEAVRRLADALRRGRVHGPVTNREMLVRSLEHPEFREGRMDTGFYERHLAELTAPAGGERHAAVAAALADAARRGGTGPGAWRNLPSQPQTKTYGEHTVRYRRTRDGGYALVDEPGVRVAGVTPRTVWLEIDGVVRRHDVSVYGAAPERVYVDSVGTGSHSLLVRPRFPDPQDRTEPGSLLAPMPGTVVRVGEGLMAGARVRAGQPLVWLEAMKMEHRVDAPASGTLTALHAVPGRQVEVGELLAVVDEARDDAGTGAEGGAEAGVKAEAKADVKADIQDDIQDDIQEDEPS
ncbi:ATP-binding protein [Streptomyces sp. MUM 178J]|uniref:ATP-binding protein n=1 Tax=Streptomyces sp. MUM 178J TaxID=2791991 RepID=UPI001F03CFEE|nr:biotin carboxylase N-terminal domain-containing protein [Streptomyces sp. MUM 178J]WRQ83554.1 biotin carboxylase N-terminal domain-containing protein [Streptomyces sp. MUM 178J]